MKKIIFVKYIFVTVLVTTLIFYTNNKIFADEFNQTDVTTPTIIIKQNESGGIEKEFQFEIPLSVSFGPNGHIQQQLIDEKLPGRPLKISPSLYQKIQTSNSSDTLKILIYLTEQADLIDVNAIPRENRGEFVIRNLQEVATRTQENLTAFLESKKLIGDVIEYKNFWVVNAVAVTTHKQTIMELVTREEIAMIYEDKVVPIPEPQQMMSQQQGVLPLNIPEDGMTWGLQKIRADEIWNLGYDGTGIIIGSIDTGVDPTHQSIVGKMATTGNGHLGWEDFNTSSPTPIDDIGHGTHTIGTMVGDNKNSKDIAIGMAPGARYYSARIFSLYNPAYQYMILAAGEWMMDPDHNPDTNDFPQIINNSWGSMGYGTRNPWFRDMVKNWRAVGILPVFAAGNGRDVLMPGAPGWSGYWSVSDPGNYPESFCVGATNENDHVSDFSRRGPTRYDELEGIIKPDIVAPGEYVISALASGTDMYGDRVHFVGSDLYWANGTSMAAPHTAGAAALLMQMHPNWTIDDIQAALMEKAVNLNEDAYTQGSGRIDAIEAAHTQTVILPTNFSLGRDNISQDNWNSFQTLEIKNLTDQTLAYNVSLDHNYPNGIDYSIFPNGGTLPPLGIENISFNISADNTVAPNAQDYPNAYEAKVGIQTISDSSYADNLFVPCAFLKSPKLNIILSGEATPYFTSINNRKDFYFAARSSDSYWIHLPRDGVYDAYEIFEEFGSAPPYFKELFSLHEGIEVGLRPASEKIDSTEAIHTINMNAVDINGNHLNTDHKTVSFTPIVTYGAGIRYMFAGFLGGLPFEFRFSDVSDAYVLLWRFTPMGGFHMPVPDIHYSVKGSLLNGIYNSLDWQNDPAEFNHLQIRVRPKLGENEVKISQGAWWLYPIFSGGIYSSIRKTLHSPYILDFYIQKAYNDAWLSEHRFYNTDRIHVYDAQDNLIYISPHLLARDTGIVSAYRIGQPEPILNSSDGTLEAGLGPYRWNGRLFNSEQIGMIAIADITSYDSITYSGYNHPNYLLYSQTGDNIVVSVEKPYAWSYELYQDEILIDSDLVLPLHPFPFPEPGHYTLKIPSYLSYDVNGREGNISVALDFDTTKEDKSPPWISRFNIFSNGKRTNKIFSHTSNNVIQFTIEDDTEVNEVSLFCYDEEGIGGQLNVENNGNKYIAIIPSDLFSKDTYVSLDINAIDSYGNTLTHTSKPAFFFGTCKLLSGSITSHCGSDGCIKGDVIDLKGDFCGEGCWKTEHFQIDAYGDDCHIQYFNGDMQGIYASGAKLTIDPEFNSIEGIWVIPEVPSQCKGKTISPTLAAIYTSGPPKNEAIISETGSVFGSIYFAPSPPPVKKKPIQRMLR